MTERSSVKKVNANLLIRAALVAATGWCSAGHAQPGPLSQVPRVDLAPPAIPAPAKADDGGISAAPYQFAVPITTGITPATHGIWETTDNGGALWRLQVASSGAHSLNLAFDTLHLPASAQLRLLDTEGQLLRGPYSSADVHEQQLWTPLIAGDAVLMDLRLATADREALSLRLHKVNYGYRGFHDKDQVQAKSGSCNVDVACPAADAWRDEVRSVLRYTINGLFLCSGTLLNNTAHDNTPFVLTANHCLSTAAEALGTVFYWNYETSSCGGAPDGDLTQSQAGALLLASSELSDFTLLQLLSDPNPDYDVHFAGWDARELAPFDVTSIHHPAGDEKRISHSMRQTEVTAQFEDADSPLSTLNPSYLKVPRWDVGTTEGGSSGAGLWNQQQRLVGQLSGGAAACASGSADNNEPDWYGWFHADWDQLPAPNQQLKAHLDRAGSGALFVDGRDPGDPIRDNLPVALPASDSGSGGGGGAPSAWLMLLLAAAALRRQRRA